MMEVFPHRYCVKGSGRATGDVELTAAGLAPLWSESPAEFDGPGDLWSPETLLVGAVADCFVLTFRAIAHASKLHWASLDCAVTGTLDHVERAVLFTRFDIRARLELLDEADAERARHALEKSERHCLITRSLRASIGLDLHIDVAQPAALDATA
jgi:organic hydroperoxide reductase OsmC/OhrA